MSALVLIVDDDSNTVLLFRTILKRIGVECISAHDGQDAITLMEHEPPDLVLLDLGLPGINGLDLITYIRQHPQLQNTKIIVVSAYVDLMHEARNLQADAYLSKPIITSHFIKTIETVLDS